MNTGELVELGQQLRVDSVRAAAAAGSGHPTSSMSAADLMAVLFARHLAYDFRQPDAPANDRFILSKGHASPLMYATYKAAGAIDDEELLTFRDEGSRLEGHPTPRRLPWVETATGSLGRASRGRRHRAGREAAGPRRLPCVGAVRRQRTRRGLGVGGGRARRVRAPGQPHADRGRQPARPARTHPARARPRRLRTPLPGLRLAHRRGRRARRGRRGPRVRRGGVHQGRPHRDPRPHPQGQGRRLRPGPRGSARQAAAGGRGGHRRTRRPARPAPACAPAVPRRVPAGPARRGPGPAPLGQGRGGGHPQRLRRGADRPRHRPRRRRRPRRRGRRLHPGRVLRQGAPRALHRVLHRRTADGRGGGRRGGARLDAVRLHLRRLPHPRPRFHPHGVGQRLRHQPRRLARGRRHRPGRPESDGSGGPGDDARGARLDRAVPVRRQPDRPAGRRHGRSRRHPLSAHLARREPGDLRPRRGVPGRRQQGAALLRPRPAHPRRRRRHRARGTGRRGRPGRRGHRRAGGRPVLGEAGGPRDPAYGRRGDRLPGDRGRPPPGGRAR